MSSFIDNANKLIQEKKFEDAKLLLKNSITTDENNIEVLKLLGLCNVNTNNTDEAINAFEKVVQLSAQDATSWFYLASMYDQKNDFEKAEDAYKQVISLRPEYIDAYKNLAVLYLKNKKHKDAKTYAQKASEIEPFDYQSYYMLGTIATIEKDFNNAVEYLEKAVSLNQTQATIYSSLGVAYFALNRLEDATNAFNKSLSLDAENPITHYHLGNIAQIQKQFNEAFKHFQKAYANAPSTLHLSALAYSALKAEKFEDAVSLYKTLCVIHPEKQNFQYNLACALVELKQYKDAISILKKLVATNPKSETMAEKLAEVFLALGEVRDAQLVYELLIKKGKVSPATYYNYAIICMHARDMDKAAKIFKKVIELDPENANAHKDLGVIYLTQRLFDYARDEFETALKLAPDDLRINFEFANFLYATADYIGAKALYERVTQNLTDNAPCYFYQGLNYLALNELENAQKSFENSRRIEQNELNTYHLARTNFYLHNYEKAIELLNELSVQDIDAQNLMALTLYELGSYEGAINIYKKILEKFNENINIMLSLAKCYIKINNKEEAINAINATLSRYPDHEEALSLLKEAEAL